MIFDDERLDMTWIMDVSRSKGSADPLSPPTECAVYIPAREVCSTTSCFLTVIADMKSQLYVHILIWSLTKERPKAR